MSSDQDTRREIAGRIADIKRQQDEWNAALEADTAAFLRAHPPNQGPAPGTLEDMARRGKIPPLAR